MMSSFPVRRAKLRSPPVAADHVRRPRLSDVLARGIQGPLTLICAPAGYGKTSLACDFVGELSAPVAWVSLDEEDATLSTFARVIVAALRTAIPGVFPEIDAVLAAAPGPAEFAARLADELDELETDVVLVLDEFERATDATVHEFLAALLEYPPRPLHLVVTTRHDPPWPLTTLRVRGLLREIRQADLRFTDAEARAFVERASGLRLGDGALTRLVARTEGWPAAVRMIALVLRGAPRADGLLSRLPRGIARVEEYLADEVLSELPDAVRRHLLRAALVARMHADLCDALAAPDDGGLDGAAFLEYLRRRNLFIVEDDGAWLRIHPLLREHLEHVLSRSTSAQEIAAVHDRARDWLDARGHVREAIAHALRSSRPASAADVLVRHRVALMNADRQPDIDAWVAEIRSETGADGPLLQLLDAWGRLPMAELPAVLDEIDGKLGDLPLPASERSAIRGEVHALRSFARVHANDFEDGAHHARLALELIPREATAARAVVTLTSATSAQAAGDLGAARRVIQEGIAEHARDRGVAAASVYLAATLVEWNEGLFSEAITSAARAKEQCDPGRAANTLVLTRTQAGIAHYRRNELREAETILRRDDIGAFPFSRLTLARTLEALALRDEADEVVRRTVADAAGKRATDLDVQARAVRAELALRRGDVTRALAWAEGVPDDSLRATSTLRPAGVVLAAVLAAAGDEGSLARAAHVLDRLEDEAARARRMPILAEVLAVRAAVAACRKDDAATLSALANALAHTRRGGMIRSYLDLAPSVIPLLSHPEIPGDLRAHARLIDAAGDATARRPTEFSPQVLASDLTNREEDVLELLAERLTNKEIGRRLHIASETVKRHLCNVYEKLHVHGRREAVAKARALGLLPPS